MIFALMFFAFYLIGIVKIKLPNLKFTQPSPDLTVTKTQALCGLRKYKEVALNSLKYTDGKYSRITNGDILENSQSASVNYIANAKGLCDTIDASRKVEKMKVSDKEWEYRYYTAVLFESNRAYTIYYFDGDWRLVLSGNKLVRMF